jgi:hypothetical protein
MKNLGKYFAFGAALLTTSCNPIIPEIYLNSSHADGYDVVISGDKISIGDFENDSTMTNFNQNISAINNGEGWIQINAFGVPEGSNLEELASLKEMRRIVKAIKRENRPRR